MEIPSDIKIQEVSGPRPTVCQMARYILGWLDHQFLSTQSKLLVKSFFVLAVESMRVPSRVLIWAEHTPVKMTPSSS